MHQCTVFLSNIRFIFAEKPLLDRKSVCNFITLEFPFIHRSILLPFIVLKQPSCIGGSASFAFNIRHYAQFLCSFYGRLFYCLAHSFSSITHQLRQETVGLLCFILSDLYEKLEILSVFLCYLI